MNFPDPHDSASSVPRRSVVLYLFACLLGGALLAPQVMKVILWLGRHVESLQSLRDVEFERVATRTVLVLTAVTLWPLLKHLRMARLDRVGLQLARGWRRQAGGYFLVGLASLGVLYVVGWASGAYTIAMPGSSSWLWKLLAILIGASVASLLEEVVFRGLLFGVWRRSGGLWIAVIWSSLLFSLVHFVRPEPVVGVAHPHWYSGVLLIPSMLRPVHATFHYLPLMVTLFLMGVGLCLVVERYQSLWPAIGLHAGWIAALRGCDMWLVRNTDRLPFWFGGTEGMAKTYATLVFALVVCGWACVSLPRRGVPD